MLDRLIKNAAGFDFGLTTITNIGDSKHDTGMGFAILKLRQGETKVLRSTFESCYVLMNGEVTFSFDDKTYTGKRHSLFDEDPIAIHFSKDNEVSIHAKTDCEFTLMQVENDNQFETKVFDADNMLESEHRGQGILNDTSYRIVRAIFDSRNRPHAVLVVGEVITFPGRWSSYPPHFHEHPEIYHYRFSETSGYGHGESGDDIYKVRQFDTLKITDSLTHAQAAAPGYGMYYLWVLKHLPNNPWTYQKVGFDQEHEWTKDTRANERVWQG